MASIESRVKLLERSRAAAPLESIELRVVEISEGRIVTTEFDEHHYTHKGREIVTYFPKPPSEAA